MPTAPPIEKLRLPVRGGQYRTSETEDGYVVIHDVPFFPRLPAWERGNPDELGESYIDGLVERCRQQIEEEHLPRAFIRHHDELGIATPEPAGFAVGKSRGTVRLRGKQEPALFGDLYVRPAVAQQIRDNELPYLSVELSPDWDQPELLGVALLPTEPPHFPLPMITLSDGAVAFRRDSVYVSFRYTESAMDPKEKTDDIVPGTDNDNVKMQSDMDGEDEEETETTINLEEEESEDTKAMTEKMGRAITAQFERIAKGLPAMVDRAVNQALAKAAKSDAGNFRRGGADGDIAKRLQNIERERKAAAFKRKIASGLKGAAVALREAGINPDAHKSAFSAILKDAKAAKIDPLPQVEAYTKACVAQSRLMAGVRGKLPASAFAHRANASLPAPIAKFAKAGNFGEIKDAYAAWASSSKRMSFERYAEMEGVSLPVTQSA